MGAELCITCALQASGVGAGQGSQVCCSPWVRKESDMTERLNWTEALDGNRMLIDKKYVNF